MQRLLEGHVVQFESAPDVNELRTRIRELEDENADLNAEIEKARRRAQDSEKAVRALRHSLGPLYNSLRSLWGEMEAIPDSGSPASANPSDSPTNAVWESWKKRLPGKPAEVIDLLLLHGKMNTSQLATALHCDPRTVSNVVYKMKAIIVKNGNDFSLKES